MMATLDENFKNEAVNSTVASVSDDGSSQDDKDMARMGKKQEFKRSFGWISSVAFTSCTMDRFTPLSARHGSC